MLEIKNVSKSFKDFTVLKDVNLTFDRGVYGLRLPVAVFCGAVL